nr:uncharacterized protein LOC116765887 [Danaus plexippus plexippus]
MVSFDIQSLFTSLPVLDCIEIVRGKLKDNNMPIEYADLLKHCLTSGYLIWKDEFYIQVDGVAIGSPVSPVVADIFMEDFEALALCSSPIKPLIYKRKPTHTDRYLNGNSHHHPIQLATVGKSLLKRAQHLCDAEQLETELRHVKHALTTNNLPVPRQHRKNHLKPPIVELQSAILPYVKGVRIGNMLKKLSIKTIYKLYKKVSQFLRPIKSTIPLQQALVYKLDYWRYIEVLRRLYDTATVQLQDHKINPIELRRGVRQGDVISPKVFTNALEDVFKTVDWTGRGINVNGEHISHLRFAHNIVIVAESLEQLSGMLYLNEASRRVGLGMNLDKTKVMFNEHVLPSPIYVEGSMLEVVQEYI